MKKINNNLAEFSYNSVENSCMPYKRRFNTREFVRQLQREWNSFDVIVWSRAHRSSHFCRIRWYRGMPIAWIKNDWWLLRLDIDYTLCKDLNEQGWMEHVSLWARRRIKLPYKPTGNWYTKRWKRADCGCRIGLDD